MNNKRGTFMYDNWHAQEGKGTSLTTFEALLYTDARIVGGLHAEFGPYTFINTVAYSSKRSLQPCMALRLDLFKPIEMLDPGEKSDTSTYHGGSIIDEVAALASILLGIRVKAGNTNREFSKNGDVRGTPIYYQSDLPVLSLKFDDTLIPSTIREVNLSELDRFGQYYYLDVLSAIAVMRCARLYQDAMWIVDSAPEIAWLWLVSSVETAANCWHTAKDLPFERLRDYKPKLAEMLVSIGGDQLLDAVANELNDTFGATRKFLEFLLTFAPSEPAIRSPPFTRVDWNKEELRKSLSSIYSYRSKALHVGVPFPSPICRRPFASYDNVLAERPGGSIAMQGVTWAKKDLPMYIHVFEYISRNAILNWWKSMVLAAEANN